MWKMYTRTSHGGGSSDYWEGVWEHDQAFVAGPQNDRICENQGSLWRLMQPRVLPDRVFLEGGCGPANWARYFHQRGYRTLALDFAPRTVERVRALAPDADVRLGDITALPVGDGSVHSYYSGGVVEHFESGPEPALQEARRVLAADGWFFCSVPDASTLRRRFTFRPEGPLPAREVGGTFADTAPPGMTFFQYAFTQQEFTERLERAGFRVESTFGYALIWGLMEIPGVDWLVRKLTARRPRPAAPGAGHGDGAADAQGAPDRARRQGASRRLIERVVFHEDTTLPLLGPVLAAMLEHCSNMRMYVARPR
jgi:SAM-dependent methyltransferase